MLRALRSGAPGICARRRRGHSRERVRDALRAAHGRVARRLPTNGVGAAPPATPRRWPRPRGVRRAARRARAAVRGRRRRDPARGRPGSCAARCRRSCPCATRPPGDAAGLGRTAGGDYPVFVGRGLLGGLPRPGRRAFVVTDANVARCTTASRCRGRAHDRDRAGGGAQDARRRRARLARARARGVTPRRPRRRPRRRRRRRPRGVLRGDLPARRAGRAGADDARRPGRLRLRRQDRGRPARGEELRRRLPPARSGARRLATLATLPPEERRGRLRGGRQDRADRRRRRCGSAWRGGAPVDERDRPRVRAHEARRRRRRRARRRRAPGAEPRPHRRPRDRDGHGLLALPPRRGRRRSGCSPRCGSRAPASCATRSPGCSAPPGCRRALEGADADEVVAATRRDKKRVGDERAVRPRPRAGRRAPGQRVEPTPTLRAAVEELTAR